MPELVIRHTGQLEPAELAAARELLFEVFDDLTEADWEHCLGGLHALRYDGDGRLVGHAALGQRRLIHDGRTLRAGYVEGVAVAAGARRSGHGAAMMGALERIARRAYEVTALGATEAGVPFYVSRGWRLWQGRTFGLTPDGVRRTAAVDDAIYVWPPEAPVELSGDLTCDWRPGDLW